MAHVLSADFVMMNCMFQKVISAVMLDHSKDHAEHIMDVDGLTGTGVAGM